ncbi:hypothetical protein AB0M95_14165 [Sphaerisporangium sp. NPDC051017]|uniref:hypothetical protein n=1 Tax=Sphaerisporangium sp. NPDC051017 TaxID=3154636 RepID=UPI00342168E3
MTLHAEGGQFVAEAVGGRPVLGLAGLGAGFQQLRRAGRQDGRDPRLADVDRQVEAQSAWKRLRGSTASRRWAGFSASSRFPEISSVSLRDDPDATRPLTGEPALGI